MKNELSNEELSDLIGAIYDCALDPGLWEPTLLRVTSLLDFCNSGLAIQALPSGDPLLVVSTGMSDPYRAQLFDYGEEIVEVFGGLEKMNTHPIGDLLVFSEFVDQTLWQRSRYLREWVTPQGIIDCAVVALARDPFTVSSLSLGRHQSAGPIGTHEVDAVRLLVPHFQRSAAISRVLEAQSVVASSFAAALDALRSAVLLVDSDLRIVHANEVAADLLAAGDPITDSDGRLSLHNEAAGAALALAVRDADKDEAAFGRRGVGIPAPRLDGSPSVLHVLPLRHGSLRTRLMPSASAAIFIAPGTQSLPVSEDVIALLFDLTPTEARVFSRVASGDTVAQTSRSLSVTESTVRTHLLRLFAKTGTRRQAELVKLAASLGMFA